MALRLYGGGGADELEVIAFNGEVETSCSGLRLISTLAKTAL